MYVGICKADDKNIRVSQSYMTYRIRVYYLCLASIEYPNLISDHNEFRLDLNQMLSTLIGLEHHLDDDSVI